MVSNGKTVPIQLNQCPREGAMHHGLCVTHRCREGRYQQPRGYQAGHDHQLRYSVSNLHWRARTVPYSTDSHAGKRTKYIVSGAIALACPGNTWLPHLWAHTQEERV